MAIGNVNTDSGTALLIVHGCWIQIQNSTSTTVFRLKIEFVLNSCYEMKHLPLGVGHELEMKHETRAVSLQPAVRWSLLLNKVWLHLSSLSLSPSLTAHLRRTHTTHSSVSLTWKSIPDFVNTDPKWRLLHICLRVLAFGADLVEYVGRVHIYKIILYYYYSHFVKESEYLAGDHLLFWMGWYCT